MIRSHFSCLHASNKTRLLHFPWTFIFFLHLSTCHPTLFLYCFFSQGICIGSGANLASLRSSGEHQFLKNLVNSKKGSYVRTWVGGNDAAKVSLIRKKVLLFWFLLFCSLNEKHIALGRSVDVDRWVQIQLHPLGHKGAKQPGWTRELHGDQPERCSALKECFLC